MTEVKGVGRRRRRTQLLDDLRNRRFGSKRRKVKIEKGGNYSLSDEHKEEIQFIFRKSVDLVISSIE